MITIARKNVVRATALVSIVAVAAIVSTQPTASAAPAASGSTTLEIEVIESTTAGDPVLISIEGAPDSVDVIVASSLGTSTFHDDATDGIAQIELPQDLTRIAGLTTIIAQSGDQLAQTNITISAGNVASVQTIVGARSIVADDADISMAVTLAEDQWGNAVANGTPVDTHRLRPQGTIQTVPTTTANLLAWVDLFSGTVAGRNTVWASLGELNSDPADLDEVAGPPLPFALSVMAPEGAPTVADGRSLIRVRTGVLEDAFDNVLADGTVVQFRWEGPDGSGTANAVLISGQAETWLQSPTTPGMLSLTARAKGVDASQGIDLAFSSAVADFPATASQTGGVLSVNVGPVVGTNGALVPDGAVATVAGPGWTAHAQIDSGLATVTIPLADAHTIDAVDVTVLGSTTTVELS